MLLNAKELALAEKYQYQGLKKKLKKMKKNNFFFQHNFYLFAKNGFLRHFKGVLNDITYVFECKRARFGRKNINTLISKLNGS